MKQSQINKTSHIINISKMIQDLKEKMKRHRILTILIIIAILDEVMLKTKIYQYLRFQ